MRIRAQPAVSTADQIMIDAQRAIALPGLERADLTVRRALTALTLVRCRVCRAFASGSTDFANSANVLSI
jgi:hypothetical protein